MIHILTQSYAVIDPWFGRNECAIELDLGCGKGGFALDLAERYPERLVLASDVMLGRLRKVERRARHGDLGNIELLRANSVELVGYQLPAACVYRAHLLCPDPWPKARHRNKRLVTTDFLTRLARVLAPGGVFHFSSDHGPYLKDVKQIIARLPFFRPAPWLLSDITDLKTEFQLIWETAERKVPHLAYVRQHVGPDPTSGLASL